MLSHYIASSAATASTLSAILLHRTHTEAYGAAEKDASARLASDGCGLMRKPEQIALLFDLPHRATAVGESPLVCPEVRALDPAREWHQGPPQSQA